MNLNIILYGTEKRSFNNKLFLNILVVLSLLSLYGVSADFIPSDDWKHIGLMLSILLSITLTICVYWISLSKEYICLDYDYMKIIAYISLPFILFVIIWIGIIHGFADICTRFTGSQHFSLAYLSKEYSPGRRQCDYKLKGPMLENAFPSYYCVSKSNFNKLPISTEYRLEGVSGFFGFHIDNIHAINIDDK
jgi:hypothetical protein